MSKTLMNIVSVDNVIIYPKHVTELKKIGNVTIYRDVPTEEEGIQRIKDADIVIDNWYGMPAHVIAAAANLKLIAVAATGYEWVDLQETKKRNITVCNSPGYATEAVAEHTIGLMLRAIRKGTDAEKDYRNGNWNTNKFQGKELNGKTLGIIGYGAIGKRVSEIAKNGFGMKILYVNSKSSPSDLETLLKTSDVISVNSPLTEQTRGLLGMKEFSIMKQGVVIVNTGRGAVIQQKALIESLQNHKIFAAGLDVLEKEPIDPDDLLLTLPHVALTPHIGWSTEESEFRLSELVTENIKAFIKGKPQNVVS